MLAREIGFCALVMLGAVAFVGADEATTVPGTQTPGAQINGGLSPFRNLLHMEPMVDIGESALGGRRVSVHVPAIFDMKLDTRPNHTGMRMSQTVLNGLVSIFMDRTRNPTTQLLSGPISVKVAGMTVYQNEDSRGPAQAPAVVIT